MRRKRKEGVLTDVYRILIRSSINGRYRIFINPSLSGDHNRPGFNATARWGVTRFPRIIEGDMWTDFLQNRLVSNELKSKQSRQKKTELTASMVSIFGIIHNKDKWFCRRLLFQPVPINIVHFSIELEGLLCGYIPSMVRIVGKVVDLTHPVGYDAISGNEVFRLNGATVA